jgi:hypothetical protein
VCLMDTLKKDLTQQIQDTIASLQRAERQAQRLLQTARACHHSFGLDYNHLDDDIAHLLGRLRYMRLMSTRWEEQETRAAAVFGAERVTAVHQTPSVQRAAVQRATVRRRAP